LELIIGADKRKNIKGTKMTCLAEYRFEILLKNATLKECEEYIKKCSEDVYLVPGGYKVKSILLLGTIAPVGFSGNDIVFQFTKPCFGFFVIRLKNEAEEIKKLRNQYEKDKNVKKIK
jgi:hypothetical protein